MSVVLRKAMVVVAAIVLATGLTMYSRNGSVLWIPHLNLAAAPTETSRPCCPACEPMIDYINRSPPILIDTTPTRGTRLPS